MKVLMAIIKALFKVLFFILLLPFKTLGIGSPNFSNNLYNHQQYGI
jgi:hypothetical protein